jgi:hypothetical protein
VPDEYIKPNGSIDDIKLRNRLSGNAGVTFGAVCPIEISREFVAMHNQQQVDIQRTIRANLTTIEKLSCAMGEVSTLIEELKQHNGHLEQLAVESEQLLIPNGKR